MNGVLADMARLVVEVASNSQKDKSSYSFPHFACYATKGYTPCSTAPSAIAKCECIRALLYQRDYVDKRAEYEQRGIPEYRIIDPIAEVVVVLALADGTYQERTFSGDQQLISTEFPTTNASANQVLLKESS